MIGSRDYLSMEGLLFKINPAGNEQMNPARMEELILNVYRHHFRGIDDPGVHYDDNVSKLLQNYRSAFLQLAYYYRNKADAPGFQGYTAESVDDRLENFSKLTNRDKARTLMQEMDRKIPESVRSISNIDLSLQLGRMFYDLGEQDELRKRLEWAESRSDISKESKMRIAATWMSTFGDTVRANKALTAAMGDDPTADDYYQAGTQMFSSGSPKEAEQFLEKALQKDPSHGQAIGALMQTYQSLGEDEKAESLLTNWVEAHPKDTGAKRRLDQLKARSAMTDSMKNSKN
jgi:tetratricopeptide (TPR) repeat protein